MCTEGAFAFVQGPRNTVFCTFFVREVVPFKNFGLHFAVLRAVFAPVVIFGTDIMPLYAARLATLDGVCKPKIWSCRML